MRKFFVFLAGFLVFMFLMTPISFGADRIEITATWDASPSSDVIGYNIYRSETSGSGYVKLNSDPITELTYLDIILDGMETTFYYVVTATDGPNESPYSNEGFVRVDNIAPDAVPNLVIKAVMIGGN